MHAIVEHFEKKKVFRTARTTYKYGQKNGQNAFYLLLVNVTPVSRANLEPTGKWLQEFLDHAHLDAKGTNGQLGGLNVHWASYLAALREAPPFSVTVQLAPPRLTAAQQRNPYLAEAASVGRSYEETIEPSRLAATLLVTAECVAKEWVPELHALAVADAARAVRNSAIPQLYSVEGKASTVSDSG